MSTQFSEVYACYVWKQWEIWLQDCKKDKKKSMQYMWILNINDAWKNQIFEKQRNLCRNFSKHNISWMKCMSMRLKVFQKKKKKTLEFNPDLPKTIFFNQFVSKTQILKTFCIKIQEHVILDGHNKITHNIMYQV